MNAAMITSKGQVTIPQEIRQRLGLRVGSRVELLVVEDHVEIRVAPPAEVSGTGFGLLKSPRAAVPADFDVASLLRPEREE